MSDLKRAPESIKEPNKIICIDTETTGLKPNGNDEILQLAIIDGNYNVLFNEYIKPTHRKSWPNAQAMHGITPKMVADKKELLDYDCEIEAILNNAELVVGYNLTFDIEFLRAGRIEMNKSNGFDVMENFAPVYGKYNEYYGDYTFQKLERCAKHYGYAYQDSHDALEDAKATLHCFYSLQEDPKLEEIEAKQQAQQKERKEKERDANVQNVLIIIVAVVVVLISCCGIKSCIFG